MKINLVVDITVQITEDELKEALTVLDASAFCEIPEKIREQLQNQIGDENISINRIEVSEL